MPIGSFKLYHRRCFSMHPARVLEFLQGDLHLLSVTL